MTDYTLVKDPLGYFRCDPIPSKDELERLYADEFYTTAKPRYLERQEDDIRWWDAMYQDRLNILEEINLGHKMLDIGCGGGFFLRKAAYSPKRSWDCFGVEPNKAAHEYAEKLDPYSWLSYSLDVMPRDFNAIHLSEVLEHVPDPFQMLSDCYDRLLPGGAICVVVPNENIENDALVYPHVFAPPQHINYFDFDSIADLIRLAGFKIYQRSAMYPMETFLQIGLDYTKSEAIGRLCHHQRMAFDLSMTPVQRRKFYRELAEHKLGREALIYAVKP